MSIRSWLLVSGLGLSIALAHLGCGSDDSSGGAGSSGKGGATSGGGSSGKGGTSGKGGSTSGGSGGSISGGGSGGVISGGGSAGTPAGGGGSAGAGGSVSGGGGTGGGSGAIQTAFVIVFENHDWSQIKASSSAPYINSLLSQFAHAENYHNVPTNTTLHPSEPNYIWLEGGSNYGLTTDNDPSASNCIKGKDHLTKQLDTAGISWKSYQEGMKAGVCPLKTTSSTDPLVDYHAKHNPQIFYDDVSGTDCSDANAPVCVKHQVPYSQLATDLSSGSIGRYNFITPNQCHDMHSNSCAGSSDVIKQGDDWLKVELPKLMASNAYKNGGAVFITWDEGSGNNTIGMIIVSPLAKKGYSNNTVYTHGSTVRTMQTILGVSPFLNDAQNESDLGDFFTQFP